MCLCGRQRSAQGASAKRESPPSQLLSPDQSSCVALRDNRKRIGTWHSDQAVDQLTNAADDFWDRQVCARTRRTGPAIGLALGFDEAEPRLRCPQEPTEVARHHNPSRAIAWW